MSKLSLRLKAIVKFVEKKDKLVDVGCDHGLLSIYLIENELVSKVIASDINQNALNSAINNIQKRSLDIETVLSDGIKDINMKGINTLVISGMGTSTILHILEDSNKLKNVKKLIIQSNNDHELLRSGLNNRGYYLEDEEYTFDKGKWYITCKFIKLDKTNTVEEVKYGYLSNDSYNNYIIEHEREILKKIPWSSVRSKFKAFKRINGLKKAISNKK